MLLNHIEHYTDLMSMGEWTGHAMRINKTIGVYDAIVDALPVRSVKGESSKNILRYQRNV
jgi:hypothetical protein